MILRYRFIFIFLASQWAMSAGNIFSKIGDAIFDHLPPLSPEDEDLLREAEMNMAEVCQKYGYVSEQYVVNTEDGYILDLYHLVREKNNSTVYPPVLLMHGIVASSRLWLDTGSSNIAFYLFDNGYDVWMGNSRGNFYTKHKKYARYQKEFWDYCLDDCASKDVPAIVDTVLAKTGAEKVVYIGYSMGTSIGFAFLSSMKNYLPKIAGYVALAPVTSVRYTTGFIYRPVLHHGKFIIAAVKALGIQNFMLMTPKARRLLQYGCSARRYEDCQYSLSPFLGYSPFLKNGTRTYVTINHAFEGVSTKTTFQYWQTYDKNGYYKYDYGRAKNLEIYHSATPPEYNLTEITIPVVLVYGPNDIFSNAINNCLLIRKLPNVMGVKLIDNPMFSHEDMLSAVDNKKFYFDDINVYLKKMFA